MRVLVHCIHVWYDIFRPIPIILDYAKILQAKYFTDENIPIYSIPKLGWEWQKMVINPGWQQGTDMSLQLGGGKGFFNWCKCPTWGAHTPYFS